jgi:hypothetical protein
MELDFDDIGAQSASASRLALQQVPLLDFELHAAGDAARGDVEAYIRSRFAAVHGACVSHFLPELLTVGHGSRYCAAVGLAPAARTRLFAEQYLDAPVERVISRMRAEPVGRGDILEIGNLVSTWKGSSLLLFVFLSELILRLGHRFVVFTATPEVERLLARLDYVPVVLATADPAQLPDRGAQWGSYYERGPKVVFGEVAPAVAHARRDLLYRGVARAIAAPVERVAAALGR